jgi:hypothetical protein
MRHRLMFISLPLVALFLAVTPIAMASSKWYVDGVNGSDNNDCKSRQHACKTIGHAISLASSGDSIMVAAATYTENLGISFSLTIVGSSAATTIIDGGDVNTVVTISSTQAHVGLSKVTVRNGLAQYGGGINNAGTLTINNSTLSRNSATNSSGHSQGGGISNYGTLTINDSTVSGNSVDVGFGGGISNTGGGTLTINNSTLSGNRSSGGGHCTRLCAKGGGIYNAYGTVTINNSTLTGNSVDQYGGGISNEQGTVAINNSTLTGNSAIGYGGGISSYYGSATLQNSIVANSPKGGNCSGSMTSKGYNLSSDGTCNFNGTGDLNNTDPMLGQLGNYGGPTQTIPLLSGSPAIDAGNPSGCTDGKGHLLKTDQRGRPRPDKEDTGGCDMGAYERQKD